MMKEIRASFVLVHFFFLEIKVQFISYTLECNHRHSNSTFNMNLSETENVTKIDVQ